MYQTLYRRPLLKRPAKIAFRCHFNHFPDPRAGYVRDVCRVLLESRGAEMSGFYWDEGPALLSPAEDIFDPFEELPIPPFSAPVRKAFSFSSTFTNGWADTIASPLQAVGGGRCGSLLTSSQPP